MDKYRVKALQYHGFSGIPVSIMLGTYPTYSHARLVADVFMEDNAYQAVNGIQYDVEINPVQVECKCVKDAELNEGSSCPHCGHRDHGRGGCKS